MATMKAAVYSETGGPDVFSYEDVPDPRLRPKSVLIRVGAVAIQGGDVLHRAGGELATRPHIVGYQAAGIIEAVGEAVTGLRPGQKAVATMPFGSHAELVSVPPQAVYVVPDSMDVKVAACIPVEFGTAHDCLFEFGGLRAGETVLVQAGASGVGLAAVQLARRAGAPGLGPASSGTGESPCSMRRQVQRSTGCGSCQRPRPAERASFSSRIRSRSSPA